MYFSTPFLYTRSGLWQRTKNVCKVPRHFWLLLICSQIAGVTVVVAQEHSKQWDKTFGGQRDEYLKTILQTGDGGYLLAGSSASDSSYDKTQGNRGPEGTPDYWLVKTDSAGNKLWDKRFGGEGYDDLTSAVQTEDGGFLLAGLTLSAKGGDISEDSLGGADFWVVRVDSLGTKLWDKRYGGTATDAAFSVVRTAGNGYLLAGTSDSGISPDKTQESRGGLDYWILQIDDAGTKLWDKRYGGDQTDVLYSVIQTTDGGYLLAGISGSAMGGDKTQDNRGQDGSLDYWVVKIDATGTKLWDKRYGGDDFESFTSAIQTSDGGFLLAGMSVSGVGGDKTEDTRGSSDYWVVKLDTQGTKLWDKRFGGVSYEYLQEAIQTRDGGILLAGYSDSDRGGDKTEDSRGFSDYWIVQLDSTGTKLWDKRFGGERFDELYSALQTKDGGFLLGGFSGSNKSGDKSEDTRGEVGYWDYWLVKTYLAPPPPEPYFVMKDTTVTTCGGTFFDPGFTSSYPDSSNYTQTFLPGVAGNSLRFVFSSFTLSLNDYLYIYNGNSTNSPLLGVFSSNTPAPDTLVASNPQGAITFRFVSDASDASPGWVAEIACIDSTLAKPSFISALWNKRYGGEVQDYLHTAVETGDGGYLLGGSSLSNINEDKSEPSRGSADYWVVRVDSAGNKLWDKTFGGTEGDYIKTIIKTSDGGYLLAGDSFSGIGGDKTEANQGPASGPGFSPDIWLIKIDADGNKLWDKTLGGHNFEYINSMIQTRDGHYLIAGASASGASGDKSEDSRGGFDYWLVKIDAAGNKLWDRRYGGSNDDYMNFVVENKGNGYLLAGSSWSTTAGDRSEPTRGHSDYWVVRVDDAGNKLWDKRFGGSMDDYLNGGLQTEDGGYLLGGDSESDLGGDRSQDSRGAFDHWLVKIDAAGNKLWDRRFGGNSYDGFRSLVQSGDGGYLLAGDSYSDISGEKTEPSRGGSDYWLVKVDRFGNKLWDKTFGGTLNDALRTAIPAADGSLLMVGFSTSGIGGDKTENSRGEEDFWIVKTTPEVYLPAPLLVNFQDKHTRTPQGWAKDFGQPYGVKSQLGNNYFYGWKNRADGTAIDLSVGGTVPGNGRKRPAPSDVLPATLIHMQGDDVTSFNGTPVESYWEVAVENGEYQVSVSVGDGTVYGDPEQHSIQVEGTQAIAGFVPQGPAGSTSRFRQETVRVTVADGMLTINADGGVNTKINYAVIQPLGSATMVQEQTGELQAAESIHTKSPVAFPNPFTDKLSVQLMPELEGTIFILVQDVVGNTYYQVEHTIRSTIISLDLAPVNLRTGIYLVTITDNNGFKQVARVVKK